MDPKWDCSSVWFPKGIKFCCFEEIKPQQSSMQKPLWEPGTCDLNYRQSSWMKHLFHNCYRIEAEQKQSDTRSKCWTNLIHRLSGAKVQSNNPESWCCSFLSFACVSVSHICTIEHNCIFFYTDLFIFLPYDKQQNSIPPNNVSINHLKMNWRLENCCNNSSLDFCTWTQSDKITDWITLQ